jgi:hypothetical protein
MSLSVSTLAGMVGYATMLLNCLVERIEDHVLSGDRIIMMTPRYASWQLARL